MTPHTKLSYAKSGVRLVGYLWLLQDIMVGAMILVLSELLGIAEEAWPGAYKETEK